MQVFLPAIPTEGEGGDAGLVARGPKTDLGTHPASVSRRREQSSGKIRETDHLGN